MPKNESYPQGKAAGTLIVTNGTREVPLVTIERRSKNEASPVAFPWYHYVLCPSGDVRDVQSGKSKNTRKNNQNKPNMSSARRCRDNNGKTTSPTTLPDPSKQSYPQAGGGQK